MPVRLCLVAEFLPAVAMIECAETTIRMGAGGGIPTSEITEILLNVVGFFFFKCLVYSRMNLHQAVFAWVGRAAWIAGGFLNSCRFTRDAEGAF